MLARVGIRVDRRMRLAGAILLMAVAACNGGCKAQVSQTSGSSQSVSAPTVSLVATPGSIASGDSSVLSWASTGASSCAASGDWSGTRGLFGTEPTGTLTTSKSYSLTCTGPGGSASASATVTVSGAPPPPPAPTVSLAANPTSITSGGSSMLTWSSTNATSCTASGAWSGTRGVSGTESTGALAASKGYSLTCSGSGGSASASVTVTVLPITGSYFTNFPNTENPFSEGGKWINAGTVGLDWTDVQTTPGLAFGTQTPHSGAPFDDSRAVLSTGFLAFSPNISVTGVIARDPAMAGEHEVELIIRGNISAHSTTGYIVDILGQQGSLYFGSADGGPSSFHQFAGPITAGVSVQDGDTWKVTVVGSIVSIYCNNTQVYQADVNGLSPTYYSTGQPGLGFYTDNSFGDPRPNSTFGWKSLFVQNM